MNSKKYGSFSLAALFLLMAGFGLLMAGTAAYFPAMKVRRLSVVDALRR